VIPTRNLLRLHRYAGLLTAPLILFFAISGIWQVFRLHEDRKDGSYKAPKAIADMSDFHKAEHLGKPKTLPFKWAVSAAAVVLVLGTSLGLIAAFRLTRPTWLAVVLLILGTAIPLLLYFIAIAK
jgi:hypothetical protein